MQLKIEKGGNSAHAAVWKIVQMPSPAAESHTHISDGLAYLKLILEDILLYLNISFIYNKV